MAWSNRASRVGLGRDGSDGSRCGLGGGAGVDGPTSVPGAGSRASNSLPSCSIDVYSSRNNAGGASSPS